MSVGAGVLAAYSCCGGDIMPKELYLKPEITSEVLEPGALLATGSGTNGGGGDEQAWLDAGAWIGACCDT